MNEKVNSNLLSINIYKIPFEINSSHTASRLEAFEVEKTYLICKTAVNAPSSMKFCRIQVKIVKIKLAACRIWQNAFGIILSIKPIFPSINEVESSKTWCIHL